MKKLKNLKNKAYKVSNRYQKKFSKRIYFQKESLKDRYISSSDWLRKLDLNQRPSGYEPDELPCCSIPRLKEVDGVEGFEPPNSGTKSHGLTAWRYPNLCIIV